MSRMTNVADSRQPASPGRTPLGILDLVPVSEGRTMAQAIEDSMELAELADSLGYQRVWYAEHHNSVALGSSATAVLIGAALDRTNSIAIGSGGIMLPNHAPLAVAEAFGTLAQMHPERVELGLGRAPGTDPMTASLLARSSAEPTDFARSILDLQSWFGPGGRAHSAPVEAGVAQGTAVPLWVLGSSPNGASIAGQLGLPFSLATHFQPEGAAEILQTYREQFSTELPTARIDAPYTMAGVNVVVAPSDEEAQFLWSTTQRMMLGIRRGARQALQPPSAPEEVGGPAELMMTDSVLRYRAVGSPDTVRSQLQAIVDELGVDEIITTTYTFDPALRRRSVELLAQAWMN